MKKILVFVFIVTSTWMQAQEVKWLTMEEALAKTQVNPKPILIDLYTNWCGWCKRMDQTTYKNEKLINYLNEHFYTVKFNAEQKEDVVLNTDTFSFVAQGKRGYHELAAALLNGKMSYPTTVFLDENFNMIQPVPGYLDAKQMEPILVFLGKGIYKNEDYEAFQKSFEGTF